MPEVSNTKYQGAPRAGASARPLPWEAPAAARRPGRRSPLISEGQSGALLAIGRPPSSGACLAQPAPAWPGRATLAEVLAVGRRTAQTEAIQAACAGRFPAWRSPGVNERVYQVRGQPPDKGLLQPLRQHALRSWPHSAPLAAAGEQGPRL